MRYTRTKQLTSLSGGKYWEYMPNVRIDEMKTLLGDYEIDKSFMWIRYSHEDRPKRIWNLYAFNGEMYARKIK
ncbi:hypothetical protein [Bacillus mycoides]|uniref:hypothetical protein n=1 Tax=Bacillus mycoides TaxID=1405 RepID=UPI00027C1799|nr:hypothetical protein [Bacillus mycoides]EJV59338.1 hypothetical protein IEU_05603 [Bacillus mycoides]